MIKFKTSKYASDDKLIVPFEVVKETPHQLTYLGERYMMRASKNIPNEIREDKISDHHRWHDTWEDAHKFLISQCEYAVKLALNQLERAENSLEKIKAYKP